jgi:hypothetical protein
MSDIHIYLERTHPIRVITLEPTGSRGPIGPQGPAGAAGPNSVTSATTSNGTANLSVATITGNGSGLTGLKVTRTFADQTAVNAATPDFIGQLAMKLDTGNLLQSTGLTAGDWLGNFTFADIDTGSILTDGDITANNITVIGTLTADHIQGGSATFTAVIAPKEVKSANFTAANGGDYITVVTLTVTDPSPSEGTAFRVLVRNGTATVGGTAYSVAGTVIERVFHSGAWANYVYDTISSTATLTNKTISGASNTITNVPISTGISGLGTGVATFLATPTVSNLSTAVGRTVLSELGFQRAFLSADFTTTASTTVTSFSVDVVGGKTYKLEIMLQVTGAAGSTHSGTLNGTFNLTAANSSMLYRRAGFETQSFVLAATPFAGFALFNTTGTSTQICFLDGIIKPSTSGTLTLTLGGTAASVTLQKGAYMEATLLD